MSYQNNLFSMEKILSFSFDSFGLNYHSRVDNVGGGPETR